MTSEKFFAELHRRIDALGKEPTEEEFNSIADQVMKEFNKRADEAEIGDLQMDEYDYLELAADAKTKKAKREYLLKGLEVAPDNFDLRRELLKTGKFTPVERLKALDGLIDEAAAEIERDNGFKEYAGLFWGVFETRPYMRLRMERFIHLYRMGMFSQAVNEAKDMLRLSSADNLGVRYLLVFLYALREDAQAMERLIKKYGMEDSTAAMLAETVLYYKRCDFDRAASKLNGLCKVVKGAKTIFRDLKGIDEYLLPFEHDIEYYTIYSSEELMSSIIDNAPVFRSLTGFFAWAYEVTKSGKRAF